MRPLLILERPLRGLSIGPLRGPKLFLESIGPLRGPTKTNLRLNTLLKLHKMTHLDEKPFKCDKCEYSCYQKRYLEKHMNLCDMKSTIDEGAIEKEEEFYIGSD